MRVSLTVLAVCVILSLAAGLLGGYFLTRSPAAPAPGPIREEASPERPADVNRPREIRREGFGLQYPGNWAIQAARAEYDPDHLFVIESPGSAFALFALVDEARDPRAVVRRQAEHFQRTMVQASVSHFMTWGRYRGDGARARGQIMGVPGGVRIFACTVGGRTLIATQRYADADLAHVQPGFDLIENSFTLNGPAAPTTAPSGPSSRSVGGSTPG